MKKIKFEQLLKEEAKSGRDEPFFYKKDKTYLIMELASKGPLVTLNEKTGVFTLNQNYNDNIYDEKLIKTWIYDIANGLKFLHENNIYSFGGINSYRVKNMNNEVLYYIPLDKLFQNDEKS